MTSQKGCFYEWYKDTDHPSPFWPDLGHATATPTYVFSQIRINMDKRKKAQGNQKPTLQKGGGKQPTTPKPPPKSKEKLECPRCYPGMSPINGGTDHKISQCDKQGKFHEDTYLPKLWRGTEDEGKAADKVESKKDAEQLMQSLATQPKSFKGKSVTKRLL